MQGSSIRKEISMGLGLSVTRIVWIKFLDSYQSGYALLCAMLPWEILPECFGGF